MERLYVENWTVKDRGTFSGNVYWIKGGGILFTPFLISNAHFTGQKNKKKHKINSRNFTYDGLI
jgi:hypothetical protein